MILSVGYVLALWASVSLVGADHVPPFWVGNGFIAGMVVLLWGSPVLAPALAFCALCSVPLLYGPDWGWPTLVARMVLNIGEGALAGWLALRVLGPRRLLRTAAGFGRLQLLAVLPAALGAALVREAWLRLMSSPAVADVWRAAFLPHLLGLAIMLPGILLLFQPTMPELRRSRAESIGILLGLGLVTHLVLNVLGLPVGFFLMSMLLLCAFRLGPRGSVFGHLVVALACLPATLHGTGSFHLHPQWTLAERAAIYQGLMLSSVCGVSLCAFMVADQARLKRLLLARAASARDARRRAVIASRSKTEFLATMSHEIRTPMNSILGFTRLLMDNPGLSSGARDQVKVIAEAGGSLMTVLNDILDFSKVEAGQIELHLEPVDLEALSAAAVEIMREPARARGLALRLETEGLDGAFAADGQRVRQVLLNLLNNAVKFTDEGHVLLAAALDKGRRVIRFEVRDTGIGIPEEVFGRLFTRFSQADSSTTRHYGGSGLGLAISKGLVERMGGRIGVESRVGAGSAFWFEIPAERAEITSVGRGDSLAAARLSGRVLLVDDHPMNLRLGETLLQLLGCEVHVAASGEEALAAAALQPYDAVLMDVHMPQMDGLATTRAIRASEGPNARTPIIAMSADVLPQSVERCRRAGMVDHVAKPVEIQALHRVLQRQLVEQRRRSAA